MVQLTMDKSADCNLFCTEPQYDSVQIAVRGLVTLNASMSMGLWRYFFVLRTFRWSSRGLSIQLDACVTDEKCTLRVYRNRLDGHVLCQLVLQGSEWSVRACSSSLSMEP
jgi:hypothetical protein